MMKNGYLLKGVASSMLGIAAMILMLVIAGLLLYGMVWASAKLLPTLQTAAEVALAICLLIFLPLSAFTKTRPFAGMGYYYASFVFGTLLLPSRALWRFKYGA